MTSTALILVDFEKEWVDPGSEYFVGDISDLIDRVNTLISFCRKHGCKIIFTTHIEKESEGPFTEASGNTDIIEDIAKQDSDILIKKHKISPFYQTDLSKHLEGITGIVTCGILTNLCVRSLVQDAYDRDFEITIVEDCCKAFSDDIHKFTLSDIEDTREEVKVMKLHEFMTKV